MYTQEQLSEMAQEALHARNNGDHRYSELIRRLGERLGMSVPEIELNIMLLAMG